MDMTPQAIRATAFRTVKRGYDPEEVEAFRVQVAELVEYVQEQALTMEARARAAVAKLQELAQQASRTDREAPAAASPAAGADAGEPAQQPEVISRTLLLAQQTADTALANARQQAATMVAEAREEATRLLESARSMAARTIDDARHEARRASEDERIRAENEVHALLARRDFLLGDVDQLQLFLAGERERLGDVARHLLDMVGSVPDGLGDRRRPLMSASDDTDSFWGDAEAGVDDDLSANGAMPRHRSVSTAAAGEGVADAVAALDGERDADADGSDADDTLDTLLPDTVLPDTVLPDTVLPDTELPDTDTVVADTVVADAVLADAVLSDAVPSDAVLVDAVLADAVAPDGRVSGERDAVEASAVVRAEHAVASTASTSTDSMGAAAPDTAVTGTAVLGAAATGIAATVIAVTSTASASPDAGDDASSVDTGPARHVDAAAAVDPVPVAAGANARDGADRGGGVDGEHEHAAGGADERAAGGAERPAGRPVPDRTSILAALAEPLLPDPVATPRVGGAAAPSASTPVPSDRTTPGSPRANGSAPAAPPAAAAHVPAGSAVGDVVDAPRRNGVGGQAAGRSADAGGGGYDDAWPDDGFADADDTWDSLALPLRPAPADTAWDDDLPVSAAASAAERAARMHRAEPVDTRDEPVDSLWETTASPSRRPLDDLAERQPAGPEAAVDDGGFRIGGEELR